jgi:D-alanyl-lipoteichoic acid acyltransferase DltB (MBOAT superfamily)
MTFTEPAFAWFFAIVFVAWRCVRRSDRATLWLLVVASFAFYGFRHWAWLPLLAGYTAGNWAIGLAIARSTHRGAMLASGVAANLLVLGAFKYAPLIATSVAAMTGRSTIAAAFAEWPLPHGISFFAFTGIAYLVDVFRREHPAVANAGNYALSAAFFPHLVAGPILRPNEFLNRIEAGRLPQSPTNAVEARWRIARGYAKKLVLADAIAAAVDPFFAHVADGTTAGVWSLPYVVLYALQIYFDFSAYTDIALGLALLFGYRWPENFDRPYFAASIADFWRRWHMTLSRFLRDYLYIPLGGNRGGAIATARNLLLTMLLGGLWHGASWSFAIWGLLHGIALALHRLWRTTPIAAAGDRLTGLPRLAWHGASIAMTFAVVCLAWCFFRLTEWSASLACVRKAIDFDPALIGRGPAYDPSVWVAIAGYLALSAVADHLARGPAGPFRTGLRLGLSLGLFLLALLLGPGGPAAGFIYFQF